MASDGQKIGKGFDRLAPIYDFIVRSVFGNRLIQLQTSLLVEIIETQRVKNVLIIGGGSGEILPFLFEQGVQSVDYVELSDEMRKKAAARINDRLLQLFERFDQLPDENTYDLILLPFVLDCYVEESIRSILNDCILRMKPDASLIITDFSGELESGYQPAWWKNQFINLLYAFFQKTTFIEARKLAPFDSIAKEVGLSMEQKHTIYDGWIQSTQWRLPFSDHSMA